MARVRALDPDAPSVYAERHHLLAKLLWKSYQPLWIPAISFTLLLLYLRPCRIWSVVSMTLSASALPSFTLLQPSWLPCSLSTQTASCLRSFAHADLRCLIKDTYFLLKTLIISFLTSSFSTILKCHLGFGHVFSDDTIENYNSFHLVLPLPSSCFLFLHNICYLSVSLL